MSQPSLHLLFEKDLDGLRPYSGSLALFAAAVGRSPDLFRPYYQGHLLAFQLELGPRGFEPTAIFNPFLNSDFYIGLAQPGSGLPKLRLRPRHSSWYQPAQSQALDQM